MSFPSPTPAAVERGFPELATIEQRAITRDDEGAEIETWSTRHSDIPCQFTAADLKGAPGQSEVRRTDLIAVVGERRAMLLGDWPEIDESDRVVISGRGTFDIRGIERDGWALFTILALEDRS